MAEAVGSGLLERETELARFREALDAARAGTGGVLLVEGEPGIGKTRLLGAAVEIAESNRVRVISARGRELEQAFGFGVVRQLFERPLREAADAERDAMLGGAANLVAPLVAPEMTPPADIGALDSFQVLHGLYWLLANLAEQGPVLIALDDAHWADAASLGFLAFVAPRLGELPMLALATTRPGSVDENPLFAAVRADPATTTLRPQPLSGPAVSRLLSGTVAHEVASEFTAACLDVTSGNPFLVLELLTELARDRIDPSRESAGRVAAIGPQAVRRAVLADLARLSPAAASLARAVAILEQARPDHAARLAELDDAKARMAADELVEASVLGSGGVLEFRHAIVRNAVYEDIGPRSRAELHGRAAKLLAKDTLREEQAASHLLRSDPSADQESVGLLQRAGAEATRRGSPEAAAAYLARALQEPPDAGMQGRVLWDLARAEALLGDPSASSHLADALTLLEDEDDRVEVTRELATHYVLQIVDEPVRAVEVLEHGLAELDDDNAVAKATLECELVCFASIGSGLRPRVAAAIARMRELADAGWGAGTPIGRRLSARASLDAVLDGEPASVALRLADQALADGEFVEEEKIESAHFPAVIFALALADQLEDAEGILSAGIDESQRRGSALGFSAASAYRSMTSYRRGALRDAEADARAGLEATSIPLMIPYLAARLIDVMIERDDAAGAERLLEHELMLGSPGTSWGSIDFREVRGRLRLAQGRPADALEDLLEAGALQSASGVSNPAINPWRSSAAMAHLALGNEAEALRLATREEQLARDFGAARAHGIALRVLGLVEGGEGGLARLDKSVKVLEGSPAQLELARSLVELGAAKRRVNHRVEAREHLRPGLELAERSGATALARRADEELRATGARPRRAMQSGVDALTASERRVARMAADGLSNPEIAQRLFVTRKTIEFHLRHCYQKLGISSRTELADALAESSDARAASEAPAAAADTPA